METARLLQRPIYGGVFGEGRYALASMPTVARGLYAVRYMVVEPQDGLVLSVADGKVEALAMARERLQAANDHRIPDAPAPQVQGELWPAAPLPEPRRASPYISRRRRTVFEASHGKCHYCGEAIELTGKWHVEHQFPRALGGGDGALNLVASCVRCNLAKGDRTALEFVAGGSRP
jgi:hypothetical protein